MPGPHCFSQQLLQRELAPLAASSWSSDAREMQLALEQRERHLSCARHGYGSLGLTGSSEAAMSGSAAPPVPRTTRQRHRSSELCGGRHARPSARKRPARAPAARPCSRSAQVAAQAPVYDAVSLFVAGSEHSNVRARITASSELGVARLSMLCASDSAAITRASSASDGRSPPWLPSRPGARAAWTAWTACKREGAWRLAPRASR
jgi:hypothetical protein